MSSDIRIAHGALTLRVCPVCGVVQKRLDAAWKAAVAGIYSDYAINHQGEGSEPVIFRSVYGSGPRATILATHLAASAALGTRGRMLDIGCANGNFLRAFGETHPEWRLTGMENSTRWRATVLGLPGVEGFVTDDAELGSERFDLIVMSHVLEHLPDPSRFLVRLRSRLTPAGLLFLAVPDLRQNPIDVLVLDHCSHFDCATLAGLLGRSGFAPESIRAEVLGKEILALARPGPAPAPAPEALPPLAALVEAHLAHCGRLRDRARALRAGHASFGILGSATAAAWLAGELDLAVDFFVDEDPGRVGHELFGRPIVALAQVPAGACVALPMAAEAAEAVRARANRNDLRLVTLP